MKTNPNDAASNICTSNKGQIRLDGDYGLCRKHNLSYDRPNDTIHRKYYSDSRFSLNHLIREHFNSTQVLKCSRGHEFNFELLKQFEMYDMNCPTCSKDQIFNKCNITVSNQELIDKIQEIERTALLHVNFEEFKILYVMSQFSPVSLPIKKLAELSDYSYQFISVRIPKLMENGFVEMDEEKSLILSKEHYLITAKAKEKVIDFIVNLIEEKKIDSEDID